MRPPMSSEAMRGSEFFGAEGGGEVKYEVSHVVGKGSYGIVWCEPHALALASLPASQALLSHSSASLLLGAFRSAAQNRQTQEKVAIKHIDRVLADKADTIRIIRELRFLRLLQHPNIIAVHDVLLPSARTAFDSIFIVFELLDTDLSHLIRSKTKYDEVHIQWLLYQLFAGLRHIHAANVFHRDLKPGNILVNANCDLKICDFGLARADFADVSKHTVFWTDYVATRWYRAPELICSYFTRYSAAVDVWAAGCICAELLRRKPLFPGHSVYHQIELITNLTGTPSEEEISKVRNQKAREYLGSLAVKPRPDWHPLFPGCHPLSVDLLTTLLTFDPDLRLNAAEAMNHPYFEMFKNVGHDRLAVPPPVMTKADFSWESEKTLTKQHLREILYQEIAQYHPERESEERSGATTRFAPTASNEVREQISALERGDKPSRASTSMPAEQTAPLFAQAQKMASQGTLEETEMIDVGEEIDMGSPVRRIPCPDGSSSGNAAGGDPHGSMQMDGDDDVMATHVPADEYVQARAQTISSDDVAKLAESAVESITPGIDEDAMNHAALTRADATTRGASWQQLSQRQTVGMSGEGKSPVRTRSRAGSAGTGGASAGGGRSGASGRTAGRAAIAAAAGVGAGAHGSGTRKDLLDVMRENKLKKHQQHTGEADVDDRAFDLADGEDYDLLDGDDVEGRDDMALGHEEGEEGGGGGGGGMSSDEEGSVGSSASDPEGADGEGEAEGGGTGEGANGDEEQEGEQCVVQ